MDPCLLVLWRVIASCIFIGIDLIFNIIDCIGLHFICFVFEYF